MLWLHGFSTYTSFPAWQAQIVISACQWFGVAIEMAWRFLSSSAFRTSFTHTGSGPPLLEMGSRCFLYVRVSGSMRYAISTPFIPRYAAVWAVPRSFRPATAIRTASLAPSTLPDDLVPAMVTVAAVASVALKKRRRVGCMKQCSVNEGESKPEVGSDWLPTGIEF